MPVVPPASSTRIAVFDIGNVLLDWDPRHMYRTLFAGRPAAMEWFLRNICTQAWNLEQDGGRRWADGVGALAARFPEWRTEIEAYDRRWHDMIPNVIEGTVAILADLKQAGTKVYAITNFSSEKYAESVVRFPFFSWFDGVIVSGDERMLKPDAAIFALLCTRYDLVPADCVFIDDNADNVVGARAAGLSAIPFTEPNELRRALRSEGFRI